MRLLIWVVLVAVVGAMTYVRLAPHDLQAVHQPLDFDADADFPAGAHRVIAAGPEEFRAAVRYMRDLPRTRVLAGDAADGLVSFVTRSRVFGFPDYTTLEHSGGMLRAYARSRFGQSDLGVNKARLAGLISELEG